MSIIIIIIISQPNCGTMKKKEKDSENLAVYAHDHELLLGKEICSMRSNEKTIAGTQTYKCTITQQMPTGTVAINSTTITIAINLLEKSISNISINKIHAFDCNVCSVVR